MEWIYISPHLDDVALSCGGLVWEQIRAGLSVSVWTICAGDPPSGPLSPFAKSLHTRWQMGYEAVDRRRLEDIASCAELRVSYRHFHVPDCIYRRGCLSGEGLYPTGESLFGQLHPQESALIDQLCGDFAGVLPDQAILVCPLTLGGHVDHKLARAAVEKLDSARFKKGGRELRYYADYPYARTEAETLASMQQSRQWQTHTYPVTEPGLAAWERAVAAYSSQVSTFWPDLQAMKADLRVFARETGGVRLWQPAEIPV